MASKTIQIEIPITVEDNASGALDSIQSKLSGLGTSASKESAKVNKSSSQMRKGFQDIGTSAERGFASAERSAKGFEKTLSQADKETQNFNKEKIEKVIAVKDKATSVISKIASMGKSLSGKAWNITVSAADKITSPIKSALKAIASPLAAAGVTIGGTAMLSDVISTYTGFEAEMSKVKAISGATEAQFEALTAKAKEMGATTKFTAEESGQAFEYMAMAGWKPQQMMDGIQGIMNLAAASGEDLATTSDIVTDALTAFNLSAEDSTHFADVMAQASASANTNVGLMGQTFQYVAPIAGAMGYSIEDTAQAIGLMANSGIKGEKAGTALRSMLTRLADPPKDAATAMEALGISITNQDGSMRSLSDVMGQLRKGFSGLTADQKAKYASDLAGQEAMSGLLAIVNASQDSYDQLADSISNADGASQKMTDTMLDNVQGKWTIFKSALDGVKIALGERLKPYLMDGIQWLTDHMPDLQEGLMEAMDKLDRFVDDSKRKFKTLTNSSEWKNADIFGKLKLSFDTLIGDPFEKWWSTKGKLGIMNKAQEIGKGLGTGISTGILTLLGIDVSSTIDDGASVGASFAKGFAEGFKGSDIQSAITSNLKGLLTNASGIFSSSPELSSFLSAALLARIGVPLIKGFGQLISGGKTLFGAGKSALGSFSLGSLTDATGTFVGPVAMQGSGILGALGKIGAGAGATTTAGSIALGAGAVGGGIAAGVAGVDTVRQGITSYKAYKEGNTEKGKAYRNGALATGGGIAAGAATGAIIGSVVPGLGTAIGALVGAGVGGIAGMIGGHKIEKDYEEEAKKIQNYSDKAKYALKGTRFESEELQKQFKDTEVAADQFGAALQNAASEKTREAFGDIKLTSQDISDITKGLLFGKDTSGLDNYMQAASDASSSLQDLQSAQADVQKQNWKLKNGFLDTEDGMQSYIDTAKTLQKSSKQFLQDSQYEANAAFSLIMPTPNYALKNPGFDWKGASNSLYESLNNQYQAISDQMDAIMSDGVISPDTKVKVRINGFDWEMNEQDAMQELQNQMKELTSKFTDAQFEAKLSMLNVKFSGAALDVDSYNELLQSLQSSAQSASDQYDQAFTVTLTNLNLQLSEGAITQDQYNEAVQEATSGYTAQIQGLQVKIESFAFQSIADAWGTSLDGILPDLAGTTAEKLQSVFDQALSSGTNLGTMSTTEISNMFGLTGLSGEAQTAISNEIQQIYSSLPDQVKNLDTSGVASAINDSLSDALTQGTSGAGSKGGTATAGVSSALQNMLNDAVNGVDMTEASSTLNSKLGESLSGAGGSGGGSDAASQAISALTPGIESSVNSAIQSADLSSAGSELQTKLNEAMNAGTASSGKGGSEAASGLTSGIESSVNSAVESADFSQAGATLNSKIGESLSSGSSSGGDTSGAASGLTSALETSVNSAVEAVDLTSAGTSLQTKLNASVLALTWDFSGISGPIGSAIGTAVGAATGWESGVSTLHSNVGSAITSQFASGYDVTTSVRVTIAWSITNPSASISTKASGKSVSASIAGFANGGLISGPQLSMVGEDGPEAIIPLGEKRRNRGLSLWKKAGEELGVPMNADGGLYGGSSYSNVPVSVPENDYPTAVESSEGKPDSQGASPSGNAPQVVVSNPQFNFTVNGNDGDASHVMAVIRKHMNEIADELGGSIADRLSEVFSNMPA